MEKVRYACSLGEGEPTDCSASLGGCYHEQKPCCRLRSWLACFMQPWTLLLRTGVVFRVRDKLCLFILERSSFELLLFLPPYPTPSSFVTHCVEVSVFDISEILVVREWFRERMRNESPSFRCSVL